MKAPLRWLFLWVGLAGAGGALAQPLLSYTPVTDSLDVKWDWALETIADNGDSGWLAWQLSTRLDEKIDPRNRSGYGDFIRWNNQSRYLNLGGNSGWRNGLSMNALLAGNERPQQDRLRELEIVLVFHISNGSVQQLLVTDPGQPVYWRNQAVAWLGSSSPEQSFRKIASLLDANQADWLQRQLIRTLGMHAVADRTAYLSAMYGTEDWSGVAPYIVEALALQKSTEVETILVNTATDENANLTTRRVAISALSRYDGDLALETLTALAGDLNPTGVRVEAVESLGMYDRPDVVELLRELVFEDGNEAVQEQALGSLAWLPGQFDTIAEIAHLHGNSELRQEAVEELAALDMAAAMEHLVQLVRTDPNQRVRRQALEEMENGSADSAVPFLLDVSTDRNSQALPVRREAVESLGAFDQPDVRAHLNELAWSDERERIREQAVESLADLNSSESQALLLEIARRHPSADTREEALDQLADSLDVDI